MYDAIILGCGASGMVCAIELARSGKRVAIIEAQSRCGKKILASGNGHCNIFNKSVSVKNFYGKNKGLIKNLISTFSPAYLESFFNSLGLEISYKADGKAYPKSMQASVVLEILKANLNRFNVDIFYDVKDYEVSKNFAIKFNNKTLKAKNLIVATGSPAAPGLGGNSSGLEIAKKFGHSIIEPLPALVPLLSPDSVCKRLSGVKVEVKIRLFCKNSEIGSQIGDILFTKYGVSGLAILDLSLKANLNRECYILIDFFKDYKKEELLKFLKSRINKERNLPLTLWMSAIINSKIAKELLRELKLESLSEKELNSKILKEITEHFKNYKIKISGNRGFKYAEVAYGGVNSKEIDSYTLESKKQKGLYFIGEVLDIVGDRGGYNFYFAFSSALKTAKILSKN